MSEIQDIAFREVVDKPSTELLVRISKSEKQPKYIGHGFVIHVPTETFRKVDPTTLWNLGDLGMVAEAKQPIFYKTKTPFARLTFNRGDAATALKAFAAFKSVSNLVFKNWI